MKVDAKLREYWTIGKAWSEQTRYEICAEERASAIVEAVSGEKGLLRWLLNRL